MIENMSRSEQRARVLEIAARPAIDPRVRQQMDNGLEPPMLTLLAVMAELDRRQQFLAEIALEGL